MKRSPRNSWLMVAMTCLWALAGCSSMRGAGRTAESSSSPPPAAPEAPPVPAPAQSESEPSSAPPAVDAAAPACTCVEAKTNPKPQPRLKLGHKEEPPQLPTAPAVVDTPPGGAVDAQVRPMSASVMSILGKRVKGPTGEDLGHVVDVLADSSGRVRVAIIDFGGFLGVGNHRIAVDWPLLHFNPGRDPFLTLSLSREKLGAAPEYKEGAHPQTLMEPPAPASTAPAPPAEQNKK